VALFPTTPPACSCLVPFDVCCRRDQPSAGPLCTTPACLQKSQLPAFQCRLFAPAVGTRCLEQAGWRSRVVADECLCMPKVRDGCFTCQGRCGTGTEAAMVWACFRALLWHRLNDACIPASRQKAAVLCTHPLLHTQPGPACKGQKAGLQGRVDEYLPLAVTLRHLSCICASWGACQIPRPS